MELSFKSAEEDSLDEGSLSEGVRPVPYIGRCKGTMN